MTLAPDAAHALLVIDHATLDATLIEAIAQRHPRDRVAAQILYSRHATALRTAVIAELGERFTDAADDIVDAVFLALLFGVAAEFVPGRHEALDWLELLARRTAREHLRAGALVRFDGRAHARPAPSRQSIAAMRSRTASPGATSFAVT
jgi:hypothetical protein